MDETKSQSENEGTQPPVDGPSGSSDETRDLVRNLRVADRPLGVRVVPRSAIPPESVATGSSVD